MNIGPIIVIGIATLVIVLVLVMLNEAAVKKGGKRKTPLVQIILNRK